ncbi:MAG: Rieske (2Fe-2S) domain protein [Marmoricola sp.]|nr:Rieske (2Fe-2S) domain protein [Marmoricola sp.]
MSEHRPAHPGIPGVGTPSRRHLVGGLLGLGVGLPLLAACGSSDSPAAAGSAGSGSGGTTAKGAIAKAADVPVGGGKIFAGDKVVLTQPTQGQFKAFSAICTHQGCPVSQIAGDAIECTCHGSKFSIKDGSVLSGPASKPLPELKVTTKGGEISVA